MQATQLLFSFMILRKANQRVFTFHRLFDISKIKKNCELKTMKSKLQSVLTRAQKSHYSTGWSNFLCVMFCVSAIVCVSKIKTLVLACPSWVSIGENRNSRVCLAWDVAVCEFYQKSTVLDSRHKQKVKGKERKQEQKTCKHMVDLNLICAVTFLLYSIISTWFQQNLWIWNIMIGLLALFG